MNDFARVIELAQAKDSVGLSPVVNDIMMSKVADILSQKRVEVSNQMFGTITSQVESGDNNERA